MKMPAVLPDSFLRCLDAGSRKKLAGGQYTAEEAASRAEIKNERALQTMIVNLLRLHGIEPLWHRTDKKSAATVGWPDITFTAWSDEFTPVPYACAWEVKFGTGKLSQEQLQMSIRLQTPPNCWRWREIRSADEALFELRALGVLGSGAETQP